LIPIQEIYTSGQIRPTYIITKTGSSSVVR